MKAQGTIEYLVIIGIVVVMSLVVVGLVMTQTNSSGAVTDTTSEIKNKVGVNGISIVESIAGEDTNGLLVLKNMESETIAVTNITVDGVDHTFDNGQLTFGGQKGFKLQELAICDGTKKSYTIKIYYTSGAGLAKVSDFQTMTIECTNIVTPSANYVDENTPNENIITYTITFNSNEGTGSMSLQTIASGASANLTSNSFTKEGYTFDGWATTPEEDVSYANTANYTMGSENVTLYAKWIEDIIAPTIYLLSPTDGNINSNQTVRFDFNVTDNSTVTNCSLKINNVDVNSKSTPSTIDHFDYNFSGRNDGYYDWNISCTDGTNTTITSSREINLDLNDYQLTFCQELQDMNTDLDGNFILMNDINCYETRTWNTNTGFKPIGNPTSFTGSLNGNGHVVSDLYIKSTTGYVALFGQVSGAFIVEKLGLKDINFSTTVSGDARCGTLVGQANGNVNNQLIRNCWVTGTLQAPNGGIIGGIAAAGYPNKFQIINSYSVVSLISGGDRTGRVIGENTPTVTKSYYSSTSTSCTGCSNTTGALADTNLMSSTYLTSQGWDFNTIWSNANNGIDYPRLIQNN